MKRLSIDTTQMMRRTEDLISAASNRYRITVQVANRAQRRRFEEFDSIDESRMKPVLRAIVEMSDELTQPEIIGELKLKKLAYYTDKAGSFGIYYQSYIY